MLECTMYPIGSAKLLLIIMVMLSTGIMVTSLNGKVFHVTGHLWGEFTGHQWIPLPKAPDSKVHGANTGPIWSRQDPGGVGPMTFAIWVTRWSLSHVKTCLKHNGTLYSIATILCH